MGSMFPLITRRRRWAVISGLLDRGSTVHRCCAGKQRVICIQQVLLHSSSFRLFVCVWKDEVRTAAAVIVNWIKFKKKKKKKVYSKELQK